MTIMYLRLPIFCEEENMLMTFIDTHFEAQSTSVVKCINSFI